MIWDRQLALGGNVAELGVDQRVIGVDADD